MNELDKRINGRTKAKTGNLARHSSQKADEVAWNAKFGSVMFIYDTFISKTTLSYNESENITNIKGCSFISLFVKTVTDLVKGRVLSLTRHNEFELTENHMSVCTSPLKNRIMI